jgi:hypothetical protein
VLPSVDGTEIFTTQKGRAEIWTAGGWVALNARVAVNGDTKKVQLHVSKSDVVGLPYPTGIVTVVSKIAGWQGAVAVF